VTLQGSFFCPGLPPYALTANVQADFKDTLGQTVQTASANVTGTANLTQTDPTCYASGVALTLTGPLQTTFPGKGVTVTMDLQSTQANVAVSPGIGFGEYGDGHVRIALIENEHRLRQALRGIREMFRKDGLLKGAA
jgi:hypothetical protein